MPRPDAGHGDELHQGPVAAQQDQAGDQQGAARQEAKKRRRKEIADGDSLQNPEEADSIDALGQTAVVEETEKVEDDCPAENALKGGGFSMLGNHAADGK